MSQQQWEEKLKVFFQKAGEELKRAGEEIKTEAERLIDDVRDPAKQQKIKQGLREFGIWARQTAEEVGELVEQGVKKAERAISSKRAKAKPRRSKKAAGKRRG